MFYVNDSQARKRDRISNVGGMNENMFFFWSISMHKPQMAKVYKQIPRANNQFYY